jgi:hypothetical protein
VTCSDLVGHREVHVWVIAIHHLLKCTALLKAV